MASAGYGRHIFRNRNSTIFSHETLFGQMSMTVDSLGIVPSAPPQTCFPRQISTGRDFRIVSISLFSVNIFASSTKSWVAVAYMEMRSTSLLRIKGIEVFKSILVRRRLRTLKIRVQEQSYFIYAKTDKVLSSFLEAAQRIVWNSAIPT